MKKWVTAATVLCILAAFQLQPGTAKSGDSSFSSGNDWRSWTQLKKLSY